MIFTNRTFGIEIEFVGACQYDVMAAIQAAGIDCHVEHYNHTTRPYWKIVTDSSLRSIRGHAYELVSPKLKGADGIEELRKVCEALNSVEGVTVNRSCGLHVHLDCNDLSMNDIRTVYERYAEYEGQIDLVMPQSRRGRTQWAASITDRKGVLRNCGTKQQGAMVLGRYYKVNLTNIATRGAIEFRQHSGTTEFRKIVNWLCFLQKFVEKSVAVAGNVTRPKTKSRWFNVVRNIFENDGYTFVWSRRLKKWQISSSTGVIGEITNQQVRRLYNTSERRAVLTCRANHEDISQPRLQQLYYELGLGRCNFDHSNQEARYEREADTGWLDGIAASVIDYLNERQDELN
ncbi:MAG: hypothetical protein CL720_05110 [Chloroflexi bacterium]|jgi:hypothetical protein|nr:hypothetical protein [Chloroflexota bacterium]|tara:strand:- start:4365 stop:5402 length:1038 start_codon:yes stop_codon:yes gene_type:complete